MFSKYTPYYHHIKENAANIKHKEKKKGKMYKIENYPNSIKMNNSLRKKEQRNKKHCESTPQSCTGHETPSTVREMKTGMKNKNGDVNENNIAEERLAMPPKRSLIPNYNVLLSSIRHRKSPVLVCRSFIRSRQHQSQLSIRHHYQFLTQVLPSGKKRLHHRNSLQMVSRFRFPSKVPLSPPH